MKNLIILFQLIFVAVLLQSCKQKDTVDTTTGESQTIVVTPVTFTNPATASMSETVELNAVSAFLLKTYIKANTNGYLQSSSVHMGQFVNKGQELFSIKTKEAQSLGNLVTQIDSSLHFEGLLHIKAPGSGFITQLNYQGGDYVQDGEQLATITDNKSFVFLLNLPYELKPYLAANKNVRLFLPDSTVLNGSLQSGLPMVDSASQTQGYIIKVITDKMLPENIIAKVILIKSAKLSTISLPKAAVLSDETQSQFWIMKMIDDSTAVKMPVTKGIETKDKVEITSPQLLVTDKILLTGNYGLPDTAKVEVVKE